MKANGSKRKIFTDAIDLLDVPEEVATSENTVREISVEEIVPFHNHPFHLYEGERLNEMVDSIKDHGILNPVIVLKKESTYEMLAGHNRWNAAKLAGVKKIPAIVKEGLTEQEAYVYVIETNMLQRSFSDLLPSEKAAVLTERYEKVMCQGKRNDILEEIARLSGVDVPDSCGHDVHRPKSRDSIGEDYGMTGRNIARYLRLNQAIEKIKSMVDSGTMTMGTAVELSYLTEEEQKQVCTITEENGIKIKNAQAMQLRNETGTLDEERMKQIMMGEVKEKQMSDAKVFAQIKKKYFVGKRAEEVRDVLEQALEL